MISELVILVEGAIMGRVYEQTDRGGTLSFQYDPGWIELKDAFPLSVSMPLAEAPYRQRFIKTFLSNLLPESPAAALIAEEKSLRDLRQALQLTQQYMAKRLGVRQHSISRLGSAVTCSCPRCATT